MWNRDLKVKIALIGTTGCAAAVLMLRHSMRFDWSSAAPAIGAVGLFVPFAAIFDRRKISNFSNLLIGFVCMVAFNLCLAVLTYAGTPLNAPLADQWLIQCDRSLGIHLPDVVQWARARPWVQSLNQVYYSVLPSTLLALVLLGLDSDVRRMREFVLHFMLAGLLTTVIYFFVPAVCPVGAFGYEPTAHQQHFLDHFHALRSGQHTVVSMSDLDGLITFPSFHTCWALLLAWNFRHYRWIRFPMLVLNILVAISTVTTGWHYATDVVGGAGITFLAIGITTLLSKWLNSDVRPES